MQRSTSSTTKSCTRSQSWPSRTGSALRERWRGRADRVAIFTAADPGAEVWPAVLAGIEVGAPRPGGSAKSAKETT